MNRLPIFHDEKNFRDRTEQMFRDMQFQMDQDFRRGLGRNTGFNDMFRGGLIQPPSWFPTGDNFDRDFFQLRPSPHFPSTSLETSSLSNPMGNQMEVLDAKTVNNLFAEDPETKSRLFLMSFDVKEYDPKAIQVKVENNCLVVEAKQAEMKDGGTKVNREFCRKIQLPNEVDPEKLTSTLSSDGILSIKAPVPPRYPAIVNQLPPQQTIQQQQVQQQQQQQQPMFSTTFSSLPSSFNTFSSSNSTSSSTNNPGFSVQVMSMDNSAPSIRDRPVFTNLSEGGRKKMDLLLDLGNQFSPENISVRLDKSTRQLTIEALKEDRDPSGKSARSQIQKQFDLGESVDPNTIQALMRNDGTLHVSALTSFR